MTRTPAPSAPTGNHEYACPPEPLAPAYQDGLVTVFVEDCISILRSLPDWSMDAVVTDPPYAIDSKGVRAVTSVTTLGCADCVSSKTVCQECRLVAEEGALRTAPMLGMQSPNWTERATHSRGYADNDPQQFEAWCRLWAQECYRVLKPGGHLVAFGGTRTWHRLASALEDVGFDIRDSLAWLYGSGFPKSLDVGRAIRDQVGANGASVDGSAASSPRAADCPATDWAGWGTALKPSHEPIVLARKQPVGTVAMNVERFGTGALNIDAARAVNGDRAAKGRWPGNVLLDDHQASELDRQAGDPVSRFFWVAKPAQTERVRVDGVAHPTVKPLALMRHLVRLVTSPGGTVLEPFAGSGTTVEACLLEGFRVVAIERDPSYLPLILQRIDRRVNPVAAVARVDGDPGLFDLFDPDVA